MLTLRLSNLGTSQNCHTGICKVTAYGKCRALTIFPFNVAAFRECLSCARLLDALLTGSPKHWTPILLFFEPSSVRFSTAISRIACTKTFLLQWV